MPGLEDLYREIILDHYRNPRNRGELAVPPAHRVEGFNPLCGDEIVVFLDVDGEGRVDDIRISGQGCSISQSSASMMAAAVKGKTLEEKKRIIDEKRAERKKVQEGILGLSKKRADWVAEELKKQAISDENSFDAVMRRSIRAQAAAKGYEFEEK